MHKIKKTITYTFILIMSILLILIIVLNNKVYTLNEFIYINDIECNQVYYEPYNIFKYRYYGKSNLINNTWITKKGTVLDSPYIPGESLYISKEEEDSTKGSDNYLYWIRQGNGAARNISKENYEMLEEKGYPKSQDQAVVLDEFVYIPYIDGSNKMSYMTYKPDEILGKVKACKEER